MDWDWLKTRIETLRESLTVKRVLAIPFIFAVVVGIVRLIPVVTGGGEMTLWGLPDWAWALLAATLLLVGFVIEYATRLRLKLIPKLDVDFVRDEGGVVHTPEKAKGGNRPALEDVLGVEWHTAYVRVRVETTTDVAVENCTAFLVSVAKKSDGFKKARFIDPIQLPWSLTTVGSIQMFKGVRRHVDVFLATSKNNKLEFARGSQWPLTLRDFLDDETTYRAEIIVVGGGLSKSIEIDVYWTGKWAELTAERVSVSR